MAGSRIDELRGELAELDRIAQGPGGLTSSGAARRDRVRDLLREAEELEASLPEELRADNLKSRPVARPPAEPGEPAEAPEAPAPSQPPPHA